MQLLEYLHWSMVPNVLWSNVTVVDLHVIVQVASQVFGRVEVGSLQMSLIRRLKRSTVPYLGRAGLISQYLIHAEYNSDPTDDFLWVRVRRWRSNDLSIPGHYPSGLL